MGHTLIADSSSSNAWREVDRLLAEGGAEDAVIEASAVASKADFERAANDPALFAAIRLLALIPQAAKDKNFASGLRAIGLNVQDAPLVSDIVVAAGQAFDRRPISGLPRNDFAELVRRALTGTLSTLIASRAVDQMRSEASDVQTATASLARSSEFALAAGALFTRLTSDMLASGLDRTLSTHVGPGQYFDDAGERARFDVSLRRYCAEATRTIVEISGSWHRAALSRDNSISSQRAATFGKFALTKVGQDLRRELDR